jgi:hypothetical protein
MNRSAVAVLASVAALLAAVFITPVQAEPRTTTKKPTSIGYDKDAIAAPRAAQRNTANVTAEPRRRGGGSALVVSPAP